MEFGPDQTRKDQGLCKLHERHDMVWVDFGYEQVLMKRLVSPHTNFALSGNPVRPGNSYSDLMCWSTMSGRVNSHLNLLYTIEYQLPLHRGVGFPSQKAKLLLDQHLASSIP